MKHITNQDIIYLSLLFRWTGWVTLFILNWKIGIAVFLIAVGFYLQKSVMDRINNTLIDSMLVVLAAQTEKNKEKEENKENEKISNNGKSNN